MSECARATQVCEHACRLDAAANIKAKLAPSLPTELKLCWQTLLAGSFM
jgi:hypothetical protein